MASSIIPKALNGDISSLNDALATCLSPVYVKSIPLDSNNKTTITVPSSSAHILIFNTSNSARYYIAHIVSVSGGTVYPHEIIGAGVTVDSETANKLILTWTGTVSGTITDIVLRGNQIS